MSEPTGRHSITMARDIAEAARVRGDPSGPYGLSACIASAVARQIDRDNLDELIQAAKGARGARPALGLLPSSTVESVAQCLDLFVISSPVTGPWSALRDRPSRDGARWAGSTNSE